MQAGQCATDTSTFPTPGTAAEVIDGPAISSDSSQIECRQHLGLFQLLYQNKLNLIRINHTQPHAICKYQGKYSRKSAWKIVAVNKGEKTQRNQSDSGPRTRIVVLTKETDVELKPRFSSTIYFKCGTRCKYCRSYSTYNFHS